VTTGPLGAVARALFEALHPLGDALRTPAAFEQLLRDLGHDGSVTAEALADLDVAATFADLIPTGEDLVDRLDDLGPDDPDLAGVVVDLIDLGRDLIAAIDELRSVNGVQLDPSLADPGLWQDVADALPGHLLVQYLEAEVPLVYGLLRFGGVITDIETATGTREVIDGSQLARIAADPAGAVSERYGWGQSSGFRHELLLDEIALVAVSLGLEVRTGPIRELLSERFFGTRAAGAASTVDELVLPVVSGFTNGGYVDTGLALVPVPASPGRDVDQLFLTNTTVGGAVVAQRFSDTWSAQMSAGLNASGVVGLRLAPDGSALEDEPPGGRAAWTLVGDPPAPWLLLGGLVEVRGVELELAVSGPAGDPELVVSVLCQDAAVVLSPEGSDSFLLQLIGSAPMRVEFSPMLAWSSRTGLAVSGTAGLEVELPLSVQLGPVLIEGLHLMLTGGGDVAELQADVTATATIGPLVATAAGVGVAVEMAPAAGGTGSLGSLELGVAFKPPEGIGVGIDLGVVSGGGFLDIDAEAGSYDGVLDLEVLGVGICAVAIIDTKLPYVDGWSMFFALFLDLPSIQLGFGFTLTGVGGVAGINRAIDADALGSAVRSGSLDTILFPEDPIADAPIIIDEFRAIFPPADGSYVFGPIVRIGWGTPTLIEAQVGIVIQLPDPLVLVVLGSISAILPNPDVELVALNLDVAGVIDFQAGTLAIDASLHDSHVVGFALSGDMALRADFADAQAFLMSVGGFHPRFDPPGDFPSLRPVTFGISAGSVLRIDFQSYFAITSNSVQCGADFTLDADVMGFGVYGSCGFDALIQFSPFMIITSVHFEVSITAAGVDLMGVMLYASVEGPNRWHVIGTAHFEVLGFGKDIRVDEVIGSKDTEPPVAAAKVLDDVVAALAVDDAWTVLEAADGAVTLREIDDPADPLFATPASIIEVRQRVVPLGITIEQYGNAPVGDDSNFDLEAVDLDPSGTLDDWFAPGRFFALSNDEKLEGPEFELMRSGVRFGGGPPTAGPDVLVDTGCQAFVIDPEFEQDIPLYGTLSFGGVAGITLQSSSNVTFTAVQSYTVATTAPTYVVVDDGGTVLGTAGTWTAAHASSSGRSDVHIERELAVVG